MTDTDLDAELNLGSCPYFLTRGRRDDERGLCSFGCVDEPACVTSEPPGGWPGSVRRYRKKPVEIEAARWDGTAEGATPIIDWILANGGTARYNDDPPTMHSLACQCDGLGIVPGPDGHAVSCPETEPTGGGPPYISIDTLEGTMKASPDDLVIRGVQGEFYPCRSDIFEATYEPASDDPVLQVRGDKAP